MKRFKLKKIATVLGLIATLSTLPAHAFDVVYDPAAVAQMVQQVMKMQQQYDVMKKQYEAMTGSYNVTGDIKQVAGVTGSWQDVVKGQSSGAFKSKQEKYDKLMTVIKDSDLKVLMNNQGFKNNYETTRMGMAVAETSYEALNEHIRNLQALGKKINSTKNSKEAADLGNAIALEQGYIQTITGRLSAVQANLASNRSNAGVSGSQKINAWNK